MRNVTGNEDSGV